MLLCIQYVWLFVNYIKWFEIYRFDQMVFLVSRHVVSGLIYYIQSQMLLKKQFRIVHCPLYSNTDFSDHFVHNNICLRVGKLFLFFVTFNTDSHFKCTVYLCLCGFREWSFDVFPQFHIGTTFSIHRYSCRPAQYTSVYLLEKAEAHTFLNIIKTGDE